MPIEFRCSSCDRILRTPDESAGKKARCPQCGAIVDIPSASPASGGGAESPADPFGALGGAGTFGGAGAFGAGPGAASEPSGAAAPFPSRFAESSGAPAGGAARPEASPYAAPSANPYAAPPEQAFETSTAVAAGGELVHSKLDLGDLLQTSFNLFGAQYQSALLVGLAYAGVYIVFYVLTIALQQIGVVLGDQRIALGGQGLAQVVSFLSQTWLQYGISYVGLRWLRTGRPEVADMFAIGPFYLRALGMGLFTAVIFALIALICIGIPAAIGGAAFGQAEAALIGALIGGLLFALPLFTYVGVSIFLSGMFLLDGRGGVFESLRLSYQYMSGNRLSVFLAMLLMGLAGGSVVMLTCCIGSIAVIPFGGLLSAVAYFKITGQPILATPATGAGVGKP